MALKTILLRKKLSEKQRTETELRAQLAGFETREAELAQAIEEAQTEADMQAVEEAVKELEESQKSVKERLAAVADEIQSIMDEIEEAEQAQQEALTDGEEEPTTEETEGEQRNRRRKENRNMNRRMELREAENFQRSGKHTYKNVRSLLRAALTTADTANPMGVGGINDPIAAAGSLIDMIKITDCTGMGSYKVAMLTGDGTAAVTAEGNAPAEGGATFDSVTITPKNYATLSYISKEIRKMTPLNYETKVSESCTRALKRALNSAAVSAVLASKHVDTVTVNSNVIDHTTLSNIMLAYGGEEGVEGSACLFLAKEDLKAFAAVRGKNEYLPVYSIVPDAANPNTGIIKDNYGLSCRYCITKDLTPLTGKTLSGTASKHMFYGNPQCLEAGLFGGYEVDVNEGYKFAEGLLTIRGDVSAGVDVTVHKGFVILAAKTA